MVKDSIRESLVQFSCILSMIGSSLVILTWAYPKKNRTKQGRILLFWLSLSDLFASCIYFIQTFHPNGDDACEINALLGIFFPVASFLWTDCIAFFLYLVVINRNFQPLNWEILLRNFHIFVWSISTLIIVLVFAFDHAGYANDDDGNDGAADNTGGWCWIKGDNPTERFVWEIIGGKFIEWISCLVILPYLYYSVYLQLSSVEGLQSKTTSVERDTLETNEDRLLLQSNQDRNRNPVVDRAMITPSPIPSARSITSLFDMSDLSQNEFIEQLSIRDSQVTTTETDTNTNTNTINTPMTHEEDPTALPADTRVSRERRVSLRQQVSQASTRPSASGRFFNQFYYKLAAVPVVLISIRIWSSLRVILQYTRPHKDNADAFFEVMQAVFDPSQGVFNAILFVLASSEDRKSMFEAFDILGARIAEHWCALMTLLGCTWCTCCTCCMCCWSSHRGDDDSKIGSGSYSQSSDPRGDLLRQRLITPGGTRSKADSSSTGHASLLETNSDYECDSNERMSDFSFDMTGSSVV